MTRSAPWLGVVLALGLGLSGTGTAAADDPPPLVIKGVTQTVTARGFVNLAEVAARERQLQAAAGEQAVQAGVAIHPPMPVPEGPPIKGLAPAGPSVEDIAAATLAPFDLMGPLAPAMTNGFQALDDANTAIPPDTYGAVGLTTLMTTLNTQVKIQNKADGAQLSKVSLIAFWSSVGGGSGAFDPRVLYDPFANKWIVVACDDARSATSGLMVGASQTSDPLGSWYQVKINAGSGVWADYPSVGFNNRWVVIQVNIFNTSDNLFNRSHIYVFDKTQLYAGTMTAYTLIQDATIQGTQVPAVTYDNTLPDVYLLQNYSSLGGQLRLFKVTQPLATPELQEVGYENSGGSWAQSGPPAGNPADFADQLQGSPDCSVSPCKIQTNDSRIQNVVYRNGRLWTTHTVFLPESSPTRASVQWWQIDPLLTQLIPPTPSPDILQRGLVDDSLTPRFFAFPSIGVNKDDDVLLGYSVFEATQFAAAAYSFRTAGDALNTMQPMSVLKAGEASYYKTFGAVPPKNRWGDYSATVVDPIDDLSLWTIQEYAAQRSGGFDRWGTWWGVLAPTPSISIADVSLDEGNSGTTPFTFTLTLSTPTSQTVTVNWATADDTATTLDFDYVGASGIVTFNPGQTSATVTVQVNGDLKDEADETFFVDLSAPVKATIADPQAVGTIVNDDSVPQVSIGDVQLAEGNTGTTPPTTFTFPVTLSNPSASTVTVNYATANGSAIAPADYATASGTVTFNPGVVSQPVTVQVVGDTIAEPNEVFYVDLSGPSGAGLLKARGVGTILDDDTPNAPVSHLVVVSDGDPVTGRNRLEWMNPIGGSPQGIRVRWNLEVAGVCTPPASATGASDGVADLSPVTVGVSMIFNHSSPPYPPLPLGLLHCYTVWVWYGGPTYSVGLSASGRPFDASGAVKWKYYTGVTAVAPPTVGLNAVIGVSNDTNVHAMQRGVAGGLWPPTPWAPVALGSISQTRSPVVPVGAVSLAFIATQDGRVTAVNTTTGAVIWSTPLTPASGQAAPAGIFTVFSGPWSYVLVGTRDNSRNNRFYALDPATGNEIDHYPKPGDPEQKVGPISGTAAVDYASRRVYFGSRDVAGSTETFWCLQMGPPADALTLLWTLHHNDVGDIDGSPVLRNGRVYVGNSTGTLFSFNATDGGNRYSYTAPADGTGIKGFAFPDRRAGDGGLYFATNVGVYGVTDTGSALQPRWTGAPLNRVDVASPSVVLLRPGTKFLYVGSSDVGGGMPGLFELDVDQLNPGPSKKPLVLEATPLVIGAPSLDTLYNLIHVGSEAGIFYAVQVPFP
jgi:outer membrane protein assembly factor BamB